MIKKILFIFVAVLTISSNLSAEYSYVRVYGENLSDYQEALQFTGDEVIKENYIENYFLDSHLKALDSLGLSYEILIEDVEEYFEHRLIKQKPFDQLLDDEDYFRFGSMSGYHYLDEIYAEFDRMKDRIDSFISIDTIGHTYENRPIIAYRFGNNQSENKVLFIGLHHAREPMSYFSLMYFAWDMIEKYESGDLPTEFILNNIDLWIIPVLNPDGYYYNQESHPDGGGMWRKNRRFLMTKPEIGDIYGVDLNRNYGPMEFWDADVEGSSTDPNNESYRGEAPFSELETQAVKSIAEENDFEIAINLHSYGGFIIYPFGAQHGLSPDSLWYQMFSNFGGQKGGYIFGNESQTVGYNTRGNSDDWLYIATDEKPKTLAMTVEVGNKNHGFWPTMDEALVLSEEIINMFYDAIFSSVAYLNVANLEVVSNVPAITKPDKNNKNLEGVKYTLSADLVNLSISDDYEDISFVRIVPESYHMLIDVDPIILNKLETTNINFDVYFKDGYPIGYPFDLYLTYEFFDNEGEKLYENYKEYKVFWTLEENKQLLSISDFDYDDPWGTIGDDVRILTDSPNGTYADSLTTYATYKYDIDLTVDECTGIIMKAGLGWEIEQNYDFFVVEVSSDNGESWHKLHSLRSKKGLGIEDSRQKSGDMGYDGFYPLFFNDEGLTFYQYYDLFLFEGKIKLRFGLLSDNSRGFNGVEILDDLSIYKYSGYISDIKEEPVSNNIKLYPQPLQSGEELTFYADFGLEQYPIHYSVFSLRGEEIISGNITGNRHNLLKNMNISSGLYVIKFYIGSSVIIRKVIVI